jgi:S1-C subfamily serine protease
LIILTGIYILIREPPVVTTTVDTGTAELPTDVMQRARQLEALNRSLAEEVAASESDPARLACPTGGMGRPDPRTDAAPLGPMQPLEVPADRVRAVGVVPPSPLSLKASGSVRAPPEAELLELLERATALVVTKSSIATGFFISQDLLVTNRHAVENAPDGMIGVASKSLAKLHQVRIVGKSPGGPVGSADFALVKLVTGRAPGVLAITPIYTKLLNVVAAGYPGLTVKNDAGFRRLISGDTGAAPDLNVTKGAVQSVQQLSNGVTTIVHTASILQGNSGGPLTDNCGRVVGINTFIAVDQEQSGRISYAQPSENLLRFIGQFGVPLSPDERACVN